MTEQQEQYTELEKEVQKWLDETDTMQFSQMELLTMFAAHQQVKNNALLHDVIERFSDDVIDKLALEKYPESFCWYGSNPPRHIDDNSRDRILWKKGFKAALNAL